MTNSKDVSVKELTDVISWWKLPPQEKVNNAARDTLSYYKVITHSKYKISLHVSFA